MPSPAQRTLPTVMAALAGAKVGVLAMSWSPYVALHGASVHCIASKLFELYGTTPTPTHVLDHLHRHSRLQLTPSTTGLLPSQHLINLQVSGEENCLNDFVVLPMHAK